MVNTLPSRTRFCHITSYINFQPVRRMDFVVQKLWLTTCHQDCIYVKNTYLFNGGLGSSVGHQPGRKVVFNSRLKVQKLHDQSKLSSVFLWGLYALGTECVRSAGTEWVWSGYGARGFSWGRGVKIALIGPRNLFRGVISLRKNFDFFSPPSSIPTAYFYPVT